MEKEGKRNLYNMVMLAFNNANVFRGIRWNQKMRNSMMIKVRF